MKEKKFFGSQTHHWKRGHTVQNIDIDDPETKKEVFFNKIEVKNDVLETTETHFSS